MARGFTGIPGVMKSVRDEVKALKAKAIKEVGEALMAAQRTVVDRTPVWQGETIINYRWGRDGAIPAGKLNALGSGPPGATNAMGKPPAGEPRRAANADAAMKAAQAIVDTRKLRSYILTNTVGGEKWDLIDSGIAPGGPGQRSRGPGGYMKLAQQTVRQRGHWK